MPERLDDLAPDERERGLVLAVIGDGVDEEAELDEIRELARTALVEPVETIVQHRAHPDRRTYVGKGSSRSSSAGGRRRARTCSSSTTSCCRRSSGRSRTR